MNGIIIVDKPAEWTSHDVVAKLRGVLKEKRVGHGGTLDPIATGVLPVFVGRATRAAQYCENAVKHYRAGLKLGVQTDTQDITGKIIAEKKCNITYDQIISAVELYKGTISQIPPMYSAIKVGGKKLYELARRGVEVERKPRQITIYDITAIQMSENDYLLDVMCSKGTYIRTLCNDIGNTLGCGACMSSLRRIGAGVYSENDAINLDEIIDAATKGTIDNLILPTESIFKDKQKCTIDEKYVKPCKNGNSFPCSLQDGEYRVYAPNGEFLMLGRAVKGEMTTIKSFFEV